jgi:hypothetical protein
MWTILLIFLTCLAAAQNPAAVLTANPYILSQDESFDFALTLQMGTARYRGASTADILSAAQIIKPLNMSLYNETFYQLARRSEQRAEMATDVGDKHRTRTSLWPLKHNHLGTNSASGTNSAGQLLPCRQLLSAGRFLPPWELERSFDQLVLAEADHLL